MNGVVESYRDEHIPVLRDRIVDLLAPALDQPGAVYLDCTLGLGGHAGAILRACPGARLVGLDRDADALAVAKERLADVADRCDFVHCVYDRIPDALAGLGITRVAAVLMDLGLSSLQIDRRSRGFAYAVDAPLDMRMDAAQDLDAAAVVNSYPERDLARIIHRYGEDHFAPRIARAIARAREEAPFTSSGRLVQVIADAIPAAARHSGGHPAKRTFQALRIEVNAELEALAAALPRAVDALEPGGRIAVLAYHSLEDRLVKAEFARRTADRAPAGLPVVPPGMGPECALLTRGAERPSDEETAHNPRAASARLRAATRLEEER